MDRTAVLFAGTFIGSVDDSLVKLMVGEYAVVVVSPPFATTGDGSWELSRRRISCDCLSTSSVMSHKHNCVS